MGVTGIPTAITMKRKMTTLETKYEAVRVVEKGTSQIKVAEKMGVPHNTLCAFAIKIYFVKCRL